MQTGPALVAKILSTRKRAGPVDRAGNAVLSSCNWLGRAGQRAGFPKDSCTCMHSRAFSFKMNVQLTAQGWELGRERISLCIRKQKSVSGTRACPLDRASPPRVIRPLEFRFHTWGIYNLLAKFQDTKAMAWLHTVLLDGLNSSLFLGYLELLQALRTKVIDTVSIKLFLFFQGKYLAILNSFFIFLKWIFHYPSTAFSFWYSMVWVNFVYLIFHGGRIWLIICNIITLIKMHWN